MMPEPTEVGASDDVDAGFGIVPRHLRGQLSIQEIGVYVGLSWRANRYGKLWIRHKRLAEEVGTSVSTVRRALVGLRDKGVVTWEPRIGPDGETDCNTYTLHVYHQAPPPVQPEQGGSSDRPGGSFPLNNRTRLHERDSMNETRDAPSASSSPSVPREPSTPTTRKSTIQPTPDEKLTAAGLASPSDRGRFREYLRTTKNARNTEGVIMVADPEDLASQVREWRRSLDVATEPDAEPVLCDHGHDVALGTHMCPTCRRTAAPAPAVESYPAVAPMPSWLREALEADPALAVAGALGAPGVDR